MTEEENTAVVTVLETYQVLDALKELIRRYGRVSLERVALERFGESAANCARIQSDLRRAADDLDAEEMTL